MKPLMFAWTEMLLHTKINIKHLKSAKELLQPLRTAYTLDRLSLTGAIRWASQMCQKDPLNFFINQGHCPHNASSFYMDTHNNIYMDTQCAEINR